MRRIPCHDSWNLNRICWAVQTCKSPSTNGSLRFRFAFSPIDPHEGPKCRVVKSTSISLAPMVTQFELLLTTLPSAFSLHCPADAAICSGHATGFCSSFFLAAPPPPCFQRSYSSAVLSLLLRFLVVNRDSWHTVLIISNGCDAMSCLLC